MKALRALSAYLEEITGDVPRIDVLAEETGAKLPLFIRSFYDLAGATIFDRRLVLAVQKERAENATPSEYANHVKMLAEMMHQETILVLPRIASYARNRLVRHGVPFIVPGKQLFLPMLMIDLRERFPRPSRHDSAGLSAPSQVVLVYYLLGNSVEGVSLRDLAARLGYSAMTLSNVRDELEAGSLCEVVKHGRSTHLSFNMRRTEVWEQAKPRLRTPVRSVHWVRWSKPSELALLSGYSSLSQFSLLSEDRLPTYAMRDRAFRSQLEKGDIHGWPGSDEADARMEAWSYDPTVLAKAPSTDKISLYLSLRHSEDERVLMALEELLRSMPWSRE